MFNDEDDAKPDDTAATVWTLPLKTSLEREKFARDYDPFPDLKACRAEYEAMEKGYRAKLYELLQRGARAAKSIRKNDELWHRFVGNAFWTKRNKNGMARQQKLKRKLNSTLRYILMFMLRARSGPAKQLARKYARSLIKHLTNGVRVVDLAATMSEPGNGIEESSRPNSRRAKAV